MNENLPHEIVDNHNPALAQDDLAPDFPAQESDRAFYMDLAIQEARNAEAIDEVPIGAVVVYDPVDPATRKHLRQPRVIATGYNMREHTQDPSAHAEFIAMKRAAEALGSWRLTGCTVYVTLEPCPMCAGLMQQSRVTCCVYGAPDPKAGYLGSLYDVSSDERLNHSFPVVAGICEEACAHLLKDYFAKKRKLSKARKASKEGKLSEAEKQTNANMANATAEQTEQTSANKLGKSEGFEQ